MLLLAITGCSFLFASSAPEEVCGDGAWTSLEACDPNEPVYGPWCKEDCTWQVCGDGVIGPDEACEGPSPYGPCGVDCQPFGCGNGSRDEGELCLETADALPVGDGALDLALPDADGDGDADLLVASADGARLWLNDHGQFERTALVLAVDRPVAVAAFEGTLFALHADGLYVAHPWALDHEIVLHPYAGNAVCTAPRAASLSVGRLGVDAYAAWVCDEGAFSVIVDDRLAFSRHEAVRELAGAATTFAVTDGEAHAPRIWSGVPDEASLGSNSPTTVLQLPAPAVAIRLPFTPDRLTAQMAVLTTDSVVVVGGTTLTATLPTPGVIDATAGWWDDPEHNLGGLAVVYVDAAGVGLRFNYDLGTELRGPNVPGLSRVLVADLDRDGNQDVVALRPVAGEVHVWHQRP